MFGRCHQLRWSLVPKITAGARALHAQLAAAGDWALSVNQLQAAIRQGLDPLEDSLEPAAHWRALDGLAAGKSRRLPRADVAAIELAIRGFPCHHLAEVVAGVWQLCGTSPDADTSAEELAEELMEAAARGDERTWFVRRAKGMLDRARPWGASAGEDADLERRGQAQAVLTAMFEEDQGELVVPLDPSDEATVTDAPLVDVMMGRVVVKPFFDRLAVPLRDVTIAELVVGVQMAAAALPMIERTMAPMRSAAERCFYIALMAPLWLESRPALQSLAVILRAVEDKLEERLPAPVRAVREAHNAKVADVLADPAFGAAVEALLPDW